MSPFYRNENVLHHLAAKNKSSAKGVGHRSDKDEQTLIASFNSAPRLAVTKTDYPRLSAPAGPSNFAQKILAKTRQIRYHYFALRLPQISEKSPLR